MPIHPDHLDALEKRAAELNRDDAWLCDRNFGACGDFSEFKNNKRKDSHMTKEEVYDDKISPLMAQVIAICKEHKIANVCSFALDDDENGDTLMCTTAMTTEEFDPPQKLKDCVSVLVRQSSVSMLTTTDGDGNTTMTAFIE